jgi:hypothetical protein
MVSGILQPEEYTRACSPRAGVGGIMLWKVRWRTAL